MNTPDLRAMREATGLDASFPDDGILAGAEPVVFRGLVSDWNLTDAGRASLGQAIEYLHGFAQNIPVPAMIAPSSTGGRLAYNDDLTDFNFRRERRPLGSLLDDLLQQLDAADPDTLYLGSTTVSTFFPGLDVETPLDLGGRSALKSIWIGNHTLVPAHQDLPDNLVCVAVGHRRFTLFPPDQLENLYIGPLDFNPAGQAISLVDPTQPDFKRFPRFAEALRHARTATLAPGDALFIPGMWWHQIEALDRFNVMLNHWWRAAPAYMDTPMNALMLAILAIRDLPARDRAIWENAFQHYVFKADPDSFEHIPEQARGVLDPMTATTAAKLRARLLQRINR